MGTGLIIMRILDNAGVFLYDAGRVTRHTPDIYTQGDDINTAADHSTAKHQHIEQ